MNSTYILSAEERIALGRQQGQIKSVARGCRNRELYAQKPTVCLCCNTPLDYEHRRNKYCSHSCSARKTNVGKVKTQATKAKLSKATRANHPKRYHTITCVICSTVFTKESRSRRTRTCSLLCKNALISQRRKQYVLLHPEVTFNRNPYRQSYLERSFEGWLNNNGVEKGLRGYLTEVWFRNKVINKLHRADFVFPRQRVIVELDGTQHEQTKDLDAIRDACLGDRGWTVIRISHKEYKNQTKKQMIEQLIFSSS